METCLKLFQNYYRGLLQLMNIFQHVQCRWNNSKIFSGPEKNLKTVGITIKVGIDSKSRTPTNSMNTKKGTGEWIEDSDREKVVR